jgi:ABC-type transport system involved in multi-copper enzyme maturation permease subunit
MLDLPILRSEARVSARSWPTYATRAAYGLFLLWVFWVFHQYHEGWRTGRPLSSKELAEFAAAAFEWLAVGQAFLVLALVPASVAGTVAEERVSRTLSGLLASGLSSAAILIDKLVAKMLRIGVILAVGMPIAFLLALLGGVDPRSVAYAYGGTISTALFLSAFSLLVSVYAKKPRTAVLFVYLVEVYWLVIPWVANVAMARWAGFPWDLLRSVNGWIFPTTPLSLVAPSNIAAWSHQGPIHWFLRETRMIPPWPLGRGGMGLGALAVPLGRMVVLQLTYAAAFLLWASARLRPVARRLADAPRRRKPAVRVRRRSWLRPLYGDDPMLWKECESARSGPARLIVGMGLLAFGLLVLVSHQALTHTYQSALNEYLINGYGIGKNGSSGRARFLTHLNMYSALFYVVALVVVAVESATGVTDEKAAGTWDGLLGTALEPAEIVRAKFLGALVRQRAVLALVLAPWLFGMALWALHPVGLLLAMTGLAAFLSFASALGTWFSLRSKTSGRALARTLGVLLVLNLGTLLAGGLLMGSTEYAALLGNTPLLLSALPLSTLHITSFVINADKGALLLGLLSAYVTAYAAVAWILFRSARRGLDAAVGRASARESHRHES